MPAPVSPLAYHRTVVDILEREQPASFQALAAAGGDSESKLRQQLLRETYRIEEAAHPAVHASISRAANALGLDVPIEVYADQGQQAANAELVFVPQKAVLVFTGPTLDLLDDDELCAVAGHELAHHQLWTLDGGRYLAAARLLDAAEGDARTPTEYLETARRYRLATELYADRAALAATSDLEIAVKGLLKVTTGLRQVDPAAYLRQAAEVDFTTPSAGVTHPETVLRAWALQQWAIHLDAVDRGVTGGVDDLVDAAIAPPVDLTTLDLPGQDRLLALTRDLVAAASVLDGLRSPEVSDVAEQYGVVESGYPRELSSLLPPALPVETRKYLAAVLADLATADSDADQEALAQTLWLARNLGLGEEFARMLGSDLGLGDRDRRRVGERADALAARGE